jgi:hypothetical protein
MSECKGLGLGIRTIDSSWAGVDFDPLEGGESQNPPMLLVMAGWIRMGTNISSYAITLLYVSDLVLTTSIGDDGR